MKSGANEQLFEQSLADMARTIGGDIPVTTLLWPLRDRFFGPTPWSPGQPVLIPPGPLKSPGFTGAASEATPSYGATLRTPNIMGD